MPHVKRKGLSTLPAAPPPPSRGAEAGPSPILGTSAFLPTADLSHHVGTSQDRGQLSGQQLAQPWADSRITWRSRGADSRNT